MIGVYISINNDLFCNKYLKSASIVCSDKIQVRFYKT